MKILAIHNFHRTGSVNGNDQVFKVETAFSEEHGHQVIKYTVSNDDIDRFVNKVEDIWIALEKCLAMGINARREYERKYRPEDNYEEIVKIYGGYWHVAVFTNIPWPLHIEYMEVAA